MRGYGRITDRLYCFAVYTGFILLVLLAGSRMVNYSVDTYFFYHYLLEWESCIVRLDGKDVTFPHISNYNYVAYMDKLVALLNKNFINIPQSNTGKAYFYKIKRTGIAHGRDDRVFVLCFYDRVVLYGLPEETFNMIDKSIDGCFGDKTGRFKGRLQKDGKHYIGIWDF